jgi:hypothetical protein
MMRMAQLTMDEARAATTAWQQELPRRFAAVYSTVTNDETAIQLGIFSDAELCSVVTLAPRAKGVLEAHLAVKKGQAVTELLPALLSLRDQLFRELGVTEVHGWVARRHRGAYAVARAVGFEETGITLLQGNAGRLLEWRQVRIS